MKILTVLFSLRFGTHFYICAFSRSENAFPTCEKHFHFSQTTLFSSIEPGWQACSAHLACKQCSCTICAETTMCDQQRVAGDNLSLVGGNEPAGAAITGSGWGLAKHPIVVVNVKWALGHPSPFATLLDCIFSQKELSRMRISHVDCRVRQGNHLCFAKLMQ